MAYGCFWPHIFCIFMFKTLPHAHYTYKCSRRLMILSWSFLWIRDFQIFIFFNLLQPNAYAWPQCGEPKKRFARYDINTGKAIGGGLPPIGVIIGLVAGFGAVGALLVYGLQWNFICYLQALFIMYSFIEPAIQVWFRNSYFLVSLSNVRIKELISEICLKLLHKQQYWAMQYLCLFFFLQPTDFKVMNHA